jgi:hypothetical protein
MSEPIIKAATAPIIKAATAWSSNAEMIADCARLGYLGLDRTTLDPTYGKGVWWQRFRPHHLVACDLDPAKSPIGYSVSFTNLPFASDSFEAVAYDPPYKLNGRPSDAEARYGVHHRSSIAERHALMIAGLVECARVLAPRGFLLVKCQDQVASGRVHWQTDMCTEAATKVGLTKVDALLFLRYRHQDRRQVHARRNYSTLLVFRAPRPSRRSPPGQEMRRAHLRR